MAYIQRKGNAYYLRYSSRDKGGGVITDSQYLGSAFDVARAKLGELVPDYELLDLQDKLRAAAKKTPQEIHKAIADKERKIAQLQSEIDELTKGLP